MTVGAIDWIDPQTAIDNLGNPMFNGSGPTFMPNPKDLIILNDVPMPGKCKIHGLPMLGIDKKKNGGTDGLAMTATGYLPGPIELETVIWTQAQWEFFQAGVPSWWTKPNKKQKISNKADPKHPLDVPLAKTIVNPMSDLWGIVYVVVLGVSIPEDGPIPQSLLIKFKCHEWTPPGNKNVTRTAGKVVIPEDNRQPASTSLADDAPSNTDLGPSGPGQPTTPGG